MLTLIFRVLASLLKKLLGPQLIPVRILFEIIDHFKQTYNSVYKIKVIFVLTM